MSGEKRPADGVIQEQHPDRCRLFMQWKQMGWPVAVDSLNRLGFSGVPITYLIDEHGIVRFVNPRPPELDEFLATTYPGPTSRAKLPQGGHLEALAPPREGASAEWLDHAYALYYVCEDVNGMCLYGMCLYRRQDVRIPVRVHRP